MAARPTTPASPKNVKIKSPETGTPVFGCGMRFEQCHSLCRARRANTSYHTEHVQRMFSQTQDITNTSIQHYKMILRSIFDSNTVVPQTSKAADGQPVTSLTPNYLCLQCPVTLTEEERIKHGNKKSHRFCMLPAVAMDSCGSC